MLPPNPTLCRLVGVDPAAVQARPDLASTDPDELAAGARVTFRDPPAPPADGGLLELRERLEQTLRAQGVQIVPWEDALVTVRRGWLRRRKEVVSRRLHAVIDLPRKDSALFRLEDALATQVVTIARVDELLRGDAAYERKASRGVRHLLEHRSEVVLGLFESGSTGVALNINLDDSEVDLVDEAAWRAWVRSVLIPKAVTPITPVTLERCELGHRGPDDPAAPLVEAALQVSRALGDTGLFPPAERFKDLASTSVDRALLKHIMDGRSGYSLGFIAAGAAEYRGARSLPQDGWEALSPLEGLPALRQDAEGIWYARVEERILEVPVVRIASSASGADKNDLTDDGVVALEAVNGALALRASRADLDWTGVRPSFDTYAMIGAVLGATFAAEARRLETGAAPGPPPVWILVHFHGYPHPAWLEPGFAVAGTDGIGVPCGTPQAGILNLRQSHALHRQPVAVASLIEPNHGTNVIVEQRGLDRALAALRAGRAGDRPQIALGGRHLPQLRRAAGGATYRL